MPRLCALCFLGDFCESPTGVLEGASATGRWVSGAFESSSIFESTSAFGSESGPKFFYEKKS
jgi:hypothetical protein